jgi:hypothetical protein
MEVGSDRTEVEGALMEVGGERMEVRKSINEVLRCVNEPFGSEVGGKRSVHEGLTSANGG